MTNVPEPEDHPRLTSRTAVRELGGPLLFFLGLVTVFSSGQADPFRDDAWISLRYARNLVGGEGLVFNPGERVEGFTNALWTLLGAGGLAVGAPPAPTLKVFGVLCGVGLLLSGWLAVRDAGVGRQGRIAAAWVLVGAVGLPYNALSGLETVAYAACVLEVLRRFCGLARTDSTLGAGLAAGGFAGAAALLRPEGVAAFGLLWIGALGLAWRRGGRDLRPFGAAGASFALPVALWTVVRLTYYGDWVPNTFHAKVGGLSGETLVRGLTYLGDGLVEYPFAPLLVGALLALRGRLDRPAVVLGLGLVAFRFVFSARVGGDYLPMGRFLVAALAPAVVAWAVATEGWPRLRVATAGLAVVVGLSPMGVQALYRDYDPHLRRYEDASRWLAEFVPVDALVSADAIGAVGWNLPNRVLDHQGLTDRTIARYRGERHRFVGEAGHERAHPEYVLEQRPTVVLLANVWLRPVPLTPASLEANQGLLSATDRFLLGSPVFFERYAIANWQLPDGRWLGAAVELGSAVDPEAPGYQGPPGRRVGSAP